MSYGNTLRLHAERTGRHGNQSQTDSRSGIPVHRYEWKQHDARRDRTYGLPAVRPCGDVSAGNNRFRGTFYRLDHPAQRRSRRGIYGRHVRQCGRHGTSGAYARSVADDGAAVQKERHGGQPPSVFSTPSRALPYSGAGRRCAG